MVTISSCFSLDLLFKDLTINLFTTETIAYVNIAILLIYFFSFSFFMVIKYLSSSSESKAVHFLVFTRLYHFLTFQFWASFFLIMFNLSQTSQEVLILVSLYLAILFIMKIFYYLVLGKKEYTPEVSPIKTDAELVCSNNSYSKTQI